MTEGSEKTAAPQGPTTETDTYHDHEGALKWALRLETVAWVPLVVAILSLVLLVSELYAYIPQLKGAPFFDAFVNLGIPVLIPLAAMAVGLSALLHPARRLARAAAAARHLRQALQVRSRLRRSPSGAPNGERTRSAASSA